MKKNITVCKLSTLSLFGSLMLVASTNSLAMLCPSNYNTIELGYSIEKILELCGNPDKVDEYSETVSLSSGVSNNQETGFYSQSQNNYYSQNQGNSQQASDLKQRIIIHKRFIYNSLQPSALIFEDGILTKRELIPK